MTTPRYFILGIPAILLAAALYGCGKSENGGKDEDKKESHSVEAVRVMELQYREISRSISYSAQVLPVNEVHLAPASPGRIQKQHVTAGDRFAKDQLLVEMDKTQLMQAMVQLQTIEKDYRRLDTLRKVGSISQYEHDQIRTQYEVVKTNVDFLKENTTLRAPFSGRVSGKYFENGELYSGVPNTAAGKAAILSLVKTDRLKALINVAERFYPHLRRGMPVEIRSDVYPDKLFTGTVSMIYPTIDAATRSFTVELAIPNPGGMLRPGMFARAELKLQRVQAFLAPSSAILKLQGSNERYIFIEQNGRAQRIVVELGDRHDDMVEIISNRLKAGDRLIVAGQSKLVDRSPVDAGK